jgi:hypothetical protein
MIADETAARRSGKRSVPVALAAAVFLLFCPLGFALSAQ